MYCPRCSQQQVSDETIFCSRCGFPLSIVRDLISSNGEGVLIKGDAAGVTLSKSERGMRKGMWVMLAGFPLVPLAGLMTAIDDVFAVLLMLPALCFIFGFLRILYAAFLEKRTPAAGDTKDVSTPYITQPPATLTGDTGNYPALPHPSIIPINNDFIEQKRTTAKMTPPPSVTEETTKLLEEEE